MAETPLRLLVIATRVNGSGPKYAVNTRAEFTPSARAD